MNILLSGGYGYGNVGDEGQLKGILLELRKHFASPSITVLSPKPDYTQETHGESVVLASRECVFFQTKFPPLYNVRTTRDGSWIKALGNFFLKVIFYILMIKFLLDVITFKYFKVVFATRKVKKLIETIAQSDIFFIVGGGYLTESTLSRLLDTSMLIFAARLLNVKCVMSGQTIGHMSHNLNRLILGRALACCSIMSTRDPLDSMKSAETLLSGKSEPELLFTSDDALLLTSSTLDEKYTGYIGIQLHFWGVNNEETILKFYQDIVDYLIDNISDKIVIFPMHHSDLVPALKLKTLRPQLEVYQYNFEVEQIVNFIHSLKMVISMKHHPLIFAFGGIVPAISINYSEYYRHKNEGAMRNFGFEKFSFVCDERALEDIKVSISEIIMDEARLKILIKDKLFHAKNRRELFWKKVKTLA